MNWYHKKDGKFGKQWSVEKKILFACLLGVGFILLCGYTQAWLGAAIKKGKVDYVATPAFADTITPTTIESMKQDVLDRLSKCETGGNSDLAITFDTNHKASLGSFQWQVASFQHYWAQMTGEKLSEKEAAIDALDDVKARQLAEYVIFGTDQKIGDNWFNCDKWNDLQTLVSFIKVHSN